MEDIIHAESVFRNFTSGRENVIALKNVNIAIQEGSFNILNGRSGSGKTTLLNILGGIDIPTSGRVFFDSREISAMKENKRDSIRRQNMGFVFQSTALIAHMSAVENVEFALGIAGVASKLRYKLAVKWLGFMGLEKRMSHYPHEMSGGEQQRVAIARAAAHNPRVLFADEPTAELDTRTAFHIIRIFRELVDTQGLTLVMTTHDVNLMDVADRILTMEDGEIINEQGNRQ